MTPALRSTAARTALALSLGLGSCLPAQAGLVTGAWDPLFGAPLQDLSWAVKAEFSVPDACIALGNGDHLAAIGAPCAAATVISAIMRIFDAAIDSPPNFNDFYNSGGGAYYDYQNDPGSPGMLVSAVRVRNGQVIGVATNTPNVQPSGSVLPAAEYNQFTLGFTLDGPDVRCYRCLDVFGEAGGEEDIRAPLNQLEQVLTSYNDNGTAKLVDADGKAIGVRLDGGGQVLGLTGTPVPEPGSLALVLGALASALWLRRRA